MTTTTLTQITAAAGQDVPINANFQAVAPTALFGRRYGGGISGLVLGYYGGTFEGNDIADGTVTLPASQATIYVVALKSTGAVSASTSNTNWNDTTNYFRIGIGATGATTITSFSDKRQAYSAQAGSGGGVAGSDKQIQFNDAGIMGAEAGFEYDKSTDTMTVKNITHTGLALTAASTTGGAGVRLPHGAAPTAPTNGDMWTTTAGLYVRINGTTIGPLGGSGAVSELVNPQTGTSYSYVNGDNNKLVTHLNASAMAGTLPQAGGGGNFLAGWWMDVQNRGSGTLTITPTTSTIDGAASLILTSGQGVRIVSDGSNYYTVRGMGSGGGGITNWTESVNTSAPNATIPVVQLLATNATAGVDAVISPKGVGALLSNVPDNTSTGGNKRGPLSVDWQMLRSSNTQVASGSQATIGGGRNNTASGTTSCVPGGEGNAASGTSSFAAGASNVASANFGVALGASNTASTLQCSVAIGQGNSSTGTASIAIGYKNAAGGLYSLATGGRSSVRGIQGARSHSAYDDAGSVGANVALQHGQYVLGGTSSNATPIVLTANHNNTLATTNSITCNTYTTMLLRGMILGRGATPYDQASWEFEAQVTRDGGNIALVGTPTITPKFASAGSSVWGVPAISVSATTQCLVITCTGVAALTINWGAVVEAIELQRS